MLLLVEWHAQLARDFPYDVTVNAFYDIFLAPLQAVASQPYVEVQTWWRHAAMHAVVAGAQACSGLLVSTVQALSPTLCTNHDRWVQEQVACILQPLWAAVPPLLSTAFEAGMHLLHTNLATHRATSEARELAQHADQEVQEDHHDMPQTFGGQFKTTKLKEVLCLLGLTSADDLLEVPCSLGCNKKKSDDVLILQMVAIDN